MAKAKARIKVPKTASAGEVITIKSLVNHRMESGHRTDKDGRAIPRKIINKFTCEFNGKPVFSCDLGTGIAANPFFEFRAQVMEAGTFHFTWIDDEGIKIEAHKEIDIV